MSVIISNDQEFEKTITENERVIVKYYADWCGSCKLFAPKYKRMAGDEANSDVVFLDINAEENPASRKLAGVSNLPFFAVFKNGELLEGAATNKEEYVKEMIEKLK